MKLTRSFFLIIGLNVLLLAFISFKPDKRTLEENPNQINSGPNFYGHKQKPYSPYEFINPPVAALVLKQLDVYEPMSPSYLKNLINYDEPRLSLTQNDHYCDAHREYFVENTSQFFEERFNFFTDYVDNSLTRDKVLRVIGNDMHPHLSASMPKKYQGRRIFDLSPAINIFNAAFNMPAFQHLGKHFSCLTQSSNRVPGVAVINRKDWVAASAIAYAERFKDRTHCFSFDKFFPQTWILAEKDQCEEFFRIFNSKEYKKLKKERTIVYISKIGAGSHRGEGVQPVDDQEEEKLKAYYKNGALCGKQKRNIIIQHYIHNPLLLNGHKFDFRMYMMIASTNPLIAFYHDGFLRVSLHQYNVSSGDKGTLLTNTALSATAFDIAKSNGTFMGMDEEELRNFQMWNFEELEEYIISTGKSNDTNWLDNFLRPQFKKAMVHLIRMSQDSYLKRSTLYELFGVDFMIDENLNLWFIECNSGPVLRGSSEEKERFLTKMLRDQLEIVLGLMRSRVKRIITFVNKLIEENQIYKLSAKEIYVLNLEQRRAEFAEITKNWFEPEFMPSPTNGFKKIIDDNLNGVERYSGLLSPECF